MVTIIRTILLLVQRTKAHSLVKRGSEEMHSVSTVWAPDYGTPWRSC
jgi:hypothetical protein